MGLIINIFGSPGAGKSTNSAELFAMMKRNNFRCELVTEYAKDVVYRGDHETLKSSQSLIFGKQHHRIERASRHVDYVITDSPLILSAVYSVKEPESFRRSCIDIFKSYNNRNFFIPLSVDNYKTYGRMQTAQESLELEGKIKNLLRAEAIEFEEIRNANDVIRSLGLYQL